MPANTVSMRELQDQVRKLEQQQRRMRMSAVVLLMLAAVALITGQAKPVPKGSADKEIRAGKFVLVDSDGTERAELGITSDGSARLRISDREDTVAAWLGVNPTEGPSLSLTHSKGQPYAELTFVDERPRLVLAGQRGKPRIGLAVWKGGNAQIDLLGDDGTRRCSIVASANHGPSGLNVHDGREKVRAAFLIGSDGVPQMGFYDPEGRNRLTASTKKDGSRPAISFFGPDADYHRASLALEDDERPVLSFVDRDKTFRLGLGLQADGSPLIELRNKEGKRTWAAP
ncbi:MAG: hypothetical protein KKB50_19975 [Planctomycetes bacterium]|nr:hypothetical protein [Planctomycetota bacterium]